MTRKDRMDLIRGIEEARDSKLIVYVTGDRPNLATSISMDIFPFLHKHLASGSKDKIDLFLYSLGGNAMTFYDGSTYSNPPREAYLAMEEPSLINSVYNTGVFVNLGNTFVATVDDTTKL